MKTPKKSNLFNLRRRLPMTLLTLSAGLILPVASGLAQTLWIGGTADFNIATNWNGTYIDGPDNATPNPNCSNDSGSNNVVLIQPGDVPWYHGDTLTGNGANTSGSYLQTGSTNWTGWPANGNWLRMGIGSGSVGYYTLSNGVVYVAGRTQLGENGYGQLIVAGGTYNTGYNGNPGIVAGQGDFGPGSGTLILSGGTINNVNNETWFGEGNSVNVGILNMSGGTFNANNWFVFGRNGGQGFGTMTGGTINFTGGGQFLIGGGGVGSLAQSGGTINAYNQYLVPQSNGGGTGTGTNILSGTAILNVHDWIAVGRNGGYGEMDISGNAAVTRDNINNGNDSNSHFDVGGGGPGVINQNGGTITESTSDFWLGETAKAIWNMNSGFAYLQNVVMSVNGGVNSTLNLNGGLFQASSIQCPTPLTSFATLNLNGATLQANASTPTFVNGMFQASIGGNSTIDSQGFAIGIPQALQDNGGGNLTKIGSGSLTLTGANSYAGSTTVSAGTLATTTASTGGGSYAVAGGAVLDVQVVGGLNSSISMSSLTFSSPSTALGVDLNNFGNPNIAPLTVGALTVNGTLTINVNDAFPQIGQFPLISYSSKTGSSYVLGPLPVGVLGTLVDDTANNSIDLKITSVNVPVWSGNAGGNWDIGLTTNWINLPTGLPTYYEQGNLVTFDDTATGTTSVNLVASVTPGSVTFNNNSLIYTLSGTGSISGSVGLVLNGSGIVNLNNTNGYTGPTTVNNGTLAVNNLANGGSPSAIGASSANPTNLVLSDAILSYTGPGASINRGYSLQNTNCVIDTEGNLVLSGTATAASDADFAKSGPAQLTYATVGINTLSGSASLGYRTIAGTTKFDGSNGGQTNNVLGHFGVGGLGGTNATVILTNTILNVPTGGVDLGRSGGATGTLSINNGAVFNATGGNFALGDGGGVVSTGVVNQAGGTLNTSGQIFVGQNNNGVGIFTLSGGTFNVNNWLAVGRQGGFGTFNMSGGVLYDTGGGGNMDIGTSAGIGGYAGTGIFNQTGGAITNTASEVWLGEGATGEPASGTWNMSGGTAVVGEVHVGVGGTGTSTVNVSGSASITESYLLLANYDTNTTGNVNIGDPLNPGGTITVNADMNVGGQGFGTLNFATNGGGKLTVTGTLYLSRFSATADGTINLNAGGTLVASYINNGWGFQNNLPSPTDNPNALNLNGGTLKANVSSGFFVQPYVNVVVQSGGAIIDDGGYTVDIVPPLVNGGGGGGLTKQGSGTLHLDGVNTYTGATLVNAGSLGVGPGGAIAGPVTVAAGATLDGNIGTIGLPYSINNTLTLSAGSATYMQITPSSSDEIIGLTSVSYGGTLVVTNVGGSPLTAGKQYLLFNAAGAGTGHFSSITVLSSAGSYNGTFNAATGILTIGVNATPVLSSPKFAGGNLILTGSGGTPAGTYSLLSSTNVTIPIGQWITNTTGVFDGSGAFSNSIPVSHSTPAQFFDLKTP